ncbi:two-component system, chemotaxis family, protein-glutamate methylesterase/glutaminase [Candidatus Magnetomoraceae bacterium gMMP-15]
MKDQIKLLVVDDSVLMRQLAHNIFEDDRQVRIIGEAVNGKEALEMISRLNPDVVLLDINMPVMDGLTALKHIMIKFPTPVVMFSTLTEAGATITFDALRYGAVDFIHKPSGLKDIDINEQRQTMIRKVRLAAGIEIGAVRYFKPSIKKKFISDKKNQCNYLFGIGTSEGGYGALLKIIPMLSPDLPAAFIIVLYADSSHVNAFARYLDHKSAVKVKQAKNGETISPGVCYLSSHSNKISISSSDDQYILQVSKISQDKMPVNILIHSIAETMKSHAGAILLSGSGSDGVEGLNEIINAGGTVILQEPKSCLCKETINSAIDKYNINLIFSDKDMAAKINENFSV